MEKQSFRLRPPPGTPQGSFAMGSKFPPFRPHPIPSTPATYSGVHGAYAYLEWYPEQRNWPVHRPRALELDGVPRRFSCTAAAGSAVTSKNGAAAAAAYMYVEQTTRSGQLFRRTTYRSAVLNAWTALGEGHAQCAKTMSSANVVPRVLQLMKLHSSTCCQQCVDSAFRSLGHVGDLCPGQPR
jgi:hypothetical protein